MITQHSCLNPRRANGLRNSEKNRGFKGPARWAEWGFMYITPISWDEITPVFTHIVLAICIRTFIGVTIFHLVYDDRLGALLTTKDGIRSIF